MDIAEFGEAADGSSLHRTPPQFTTPASARRLLPKSRSPFGIDQIQIASHWADACFDIPHERGKRARPEVDAVSSLVHISVRQYAVISVCTMPHCERWVIACPDEKTLRDLLAGPSIVALGYCSREEAEASIPYRTRALPLWRKSITALVASSRRALRELVSNHPLGKGKFRLGMTHSTICGLLQQTFVTAIVGLYSKNALSAAIRALISS